jgi:hypothetical protein
LITVRRTPVPTPVDHPGATLNTMPLAASVGQRDSGGSDLEPGAHPLTTRHTVITNILRSPCDEPTAVVTSTHSIVADSGAARSEPPHRRHPQTNSSARCAWLAGTRSGAQYGQEQNGPVEAEGPSHAGHGIRAANVIHRQLAQHPEGARSGLQKATSCCSHSSMRASAPTWRLRSSSDS